MVIDVKYFYFHCIKDHSCENCASDITFSSYFSKPSEKWQQKDYRLVIQLYFYGLSFLTIFKYK